MAGYWTVPDVRRKLSSATPPFAALTSAPSLARGHVRATLTEWGMADLTDIAELIASEMVTNAVEESALAQDGGALVVRVCLIADGDVLTIECWDQAPGMPVLQSADPLAESGRGLAIIDTLTSGSWGYQPAIGQHGKCVWAELPLREKPAAQDLAAPSVPGLT